MPAACIVVASFCFGSFCYAVQISCSGISMKREINYVPSLRAHKSLALVASHEDTLRRQTKMFDQQATLSRLRAGHSQLKLVSLSTESICYLHFVC